MTTTTINTAILKTNTKKAILLQGALLAAAILLPMLCHVFKFSGAMLLPMHYPILLAGLVYGARAGLMLGATSVLLSFVLTGMPPAALLPMMTVELAIYGLVSGLCRQNGIGYLVSTLTALAVGKLAFVGLGYILIGGFSFRGLSIGLASIMLQIIILPVLAGLWTKKLQ